MADELISRQALMRNFCGYDLNECVKYGNKTAEQQNNSYSTMMMYEIANEIEDAPAVDAVEVCRCVNCIHFGAEASAYDAWTPMCLKWKRTTFPNDFCSYGERRDDDA